MRNKGVVRFQLSQEENNTLHSTQQQSIQCSLSSQLQLLTYVYYCSTAIFIVSLPPLEY